VAQIVVSHGHLLTGVNVAAGSPAGLATGIVTGSTTISGAGETVARSERSHAGRTALSGSTAPAEKTPTASTQCRNAAERRRSSILVRSAAARIIDERIVASNNRLIETRS
jgi:hypothetical protein